MDAFQTVIASWSDFVKALSHGNASDIKINIQSEGDIHCYLYHLILCRLGDPHLIQSEFKHGNEKIDLKVADIYIEIKWIDLEKKKNQKFFKMTTLPEEIEKLLKFQDVPYKILVVVFRNKNGRIPLHKDEVEKDHLNCLKSIKRDFEGTAGTNKLLTTFVF